MEDITKDILKKLNLMKDKHYNLGNGEVAIAFGETIKPGKNNVIPFIRICDLEEKISTSDFMPIMHCIRKSFLEPLF